MLIWFLARVRWKQNLVRLCWEKVKVCSANLPILFTFKWGSYFHTLRTEAMTSSLTNRECCSQVRLGYVTQSWQLWQITLLSHYHSRDLFKWFICHCLLIWLCHSSAIHSNTVNMLIIYAAAAAKIHTEHDVVVSVIQSLLHQEICDEASGLSRATAEERSPDKSLKEP